MLPFLLLALVPLVASAHPLCPFNAAAARARIAPAARAGMAGLKDVFADFETRFGPCQKITEGKNPVFRFGVAEIPWRATKDKQGMWTGLSFGPAVFPGDSPAKIKADVTATGARLFARGSAGGALSADGEEESEVGETAYLLWLNEYRRAVREGRLKTSSVVETKSAPEGILTLGPLVSWPAGVPVTLETAALLAFRSKDNLAADLILGAVGGRIGGRQITPFAAAISAPGEKKGWRHSPRALCEAALALGADPAFPGGLGAAEGRHRFYEFQGEFPATYAVVHLSQPKEGGNFTCAAVVFPKPTPASYTRARDFLDRVYDLEGSLPQDALVKSPEN